MSETKAQQNIPKDHTGGLEKLTNTEDARSWQPPTMTIKGKVIQSAWKEKARKPTEKIEPVSKSNRPANLTVEQLTTISEEAKKEGYEAGFAEGFSAGKTEGLTKGLNEGSQKGYKQTIKEVQDKQTRLSEIAKNLLLPMQNQQQNIENIVVDIAMNIAKKIIHDELTCAPEKIFYIAKKAIDSLPVGTSNIDVYLNTEDKELLETLLQNNASEFAQIENWSLKEDNTLQQGGCNVVSQESLVNYSVESRIEDYFKGIEQSPDVSPNDQDLIARPEQEKIDAYNKKEQEDAPAVEQITDSTPGESNVETEAVSSIDTPINTGADTEIQTETSQTLAPQKENDTITENTTKTHLDNTPSEGDDAS